MRRVKKIAIITLYGETNFGNRLQNYAVHQYLTQMGAACETLVFEKKSSIKSRIKKQLKLVLCHFVINNDEMNRVVSFKHFSDQYIPKRQIDARYSMEKLAKEYDYFVVGSDQVWNPCFGDFNELFDRMFLTFVPGNKRICFSPSFGVSKIPPEWEQKFAYALSGFDFLCTREDEGVRIIRELTSKDAVRLIDPTMLFDGEQWLRVAQKTTEKDYILTYFLGDYPKKALPSGKKIINLLDKDNGNYYRYNPADFVGLIAGADAVYTDSFHACVFSLLFDKPFCVMERKDGHAAMSSRIQSLLAMFDISFDDAVSSLIHVDTKQRDKVLQIEREKVRKYICAQINAEDI